MYLPAPYPAGGATWEAAVPLERRRLLRPQTRHPLGVEPQVQAMSPL